MVVVGTRLGAGWFKILPCWLPRRLRAMIQHSTIRPMISASPITEPITIPAIAPPDSPFEAGAGVADGVLVPEGNRGGIDEIVGNTIPAHRPVTFEATQQESVALGELAPQKLHRPRRLLEYPQSTDSFSSPLMHEPLRESAGSAQLVKSARICEMYSVPGSPQRSLLAAIRYSPMACFAYNLIRHACVIKTG